MAVVSSSVGGSSAAVTRYLAAGADPIALAIVRFGLGFLIVLPVAAAARIRWPRLQDWPGVAGLGVMFFAIAIVLYNVWSRPFIDRSGALGFLTVGMGAGQSL